MGTVLSIIGCLIASPAPTYLMKAVPPVHRYSNPTYLETSPSVRWVWGSLANTAAQDLFKGNNIRKPLALAGAVAKAVFPQDPSWVTTIRLQA